MNLKPGLSTKIRRRNDLLGRPWEFAVRTPDKIYIEMVDSSAPFGEALILDWAGFLKYLKKYRSKRYP